METVSENLVKLASDKIAPLDTSSKKPLLCFLLGQGIGINVSE